MVTCVHVSIMQLDMSGGGQKWHLWERGNAGFPPYLPFSYHLLLLCSFTSLLSSALHLSHISSDGLVWLWQGGVGIVVGKALGIAFHWRGESIMPHGEENTGAFLLAKASTDQTQNIFCPVFLQLTIFCVLCCMSVPLKQPQAEGNMWWIRTVRKTTYLMLMWQIGVTPQSYMAVDHKPWGFNVFKSSWNAKQRNRVIDSPSNHAWCRIYSTGCHVCWLATHG